MKQVWKRRAVVAAVLVYVNGHEVGYAEDSFTPHRFDLTPYVHVGENRLALRVFKRCTGSWMEDQDFWRFSGIHRSVSLHFYPETHLYDLRVRTPLTDNYTRATLETRLRVMGASLGKAELTLAGVLHEVRAVNDAGDGDSKLGFGLSGAGKIPFGPDGRHDVRFMLSYGQGIGHYLGLNFGPDAVLAGTDLSTVDVVAGFAAIRFGWTPTVRRSTRCC